MACAHWKDSPLSLLHHIYSLQYKKCASLNQHVWCLLGHAENYCCKIIHVIYNRKALGIRKPKVFIFFASRHLTMELKYNWHSSPCLSCNFWTNEDNFKIPSCGYLGVTHWCVWRKCHSLMWLEINNSQQQRLFQFCIAQNRFTNMASFFWIN